MQNSQWRRFSPVTTRSLSVLIVSHLRVQRCVSFSIILVEFKGTELRLKRHVLASAPTCLRCKWLHSSVWHTNSIMHSWAVRASLLLLLEATCLPYYHRNFIQQDLTTCITGKGRSLLCYSVWSPCFYSLQIISFNIEKDFWYVVVCENSEGCWSRSATKLHEQKSHKGTHPSVKCYNETFYKIHKYADKLRWIVILNHLGETYHKIWDQCRLTK